MNAMQLILILLGVARPTMSLQRGSSVGQAEQLRLVGSKESGPTQPTSIYATYGKNCGDGVGKDVTEAMMERCATFPCNWKADNLGADPYHGCAKNMDITWQCGTETFTAHKGGEAGGQTIYVGCPAECPSGWVQLGEIGDDIPGWGMSRDGNKAASVSECAAQCDAEKPSCGSFEFIDSTGDCALVSWKDTSTDKQTGHVERMLTCQLPPPSCPSGYSQIGVLGNDIPGWGIVADGNQAASTELCAAQCDARSDCGYFEFVGGDCGMFGFDISESSFSGTVYNMLTCQKTLDPTPAPTVPSGQCIWSNTECASIDNWEDELFGKCRCFGDPHCTETFYSGMPSTYFQGNGVYDMASSTDGCFQMQQFQCPFSQGFNPPGYSVGVGLAIKMEGKTIVFSRNNIYVDGELVDRSSSEQYPFNLNLHGYVPGAVELTSWDKCLRLSLHTEGANWFLGGNPTAFHNFHLAAMKSLLTKKGLCGNTDDTHTPVDRSELLFTPSQVEELCNLCTGPGKPQICYESPIPTPPPVVPPGPREACENADPPIPYSTAEAACVALKDDKNYFEACILDYCMTGGNENSTIYVIAETPDPTPVPTPSPPTPAPTPCDESRGECTVVEDPHLSPFDGGQISLLSFSTSSSSDSGDKWLVKSEYVSIQARYVDFKDVPEKKTFVRALAIGGPFLKGNKMVIGSLEDQITWNGEPILLDQSSSFEMKGQVSVTATRSLHSRNVAVASQESPGVDIELPMNVSLTVNRLHGHLNVAIKMPPQEGGQEGLCGNFNGVAADDQLEFESKRFSAEVLRSESLFSDMSADFAA